MRHRITSFRAVEPKTPLLSGWDWWHPRLYPRIATGPALFVSNTATHNKPCVRFFSRQNWRLPRVFPRSIHRLATVLDDPADLGPARHMKWRHAACLDREAAARERHRVQQRVARRHAHLERPRAGCRLQGARLGLRADGKRGRARRRRGFAALDEHSARCRVATQHQAAAGKACHGLRALLAPPPIARGCRQVLPADSRRGHWQGRRGRLRRGRGRGRGGGDHPRSATGTEDERGRDGEGDRKQVCFHRHRME